MKARLKRLPSGHWEIRQGDYRARLTLVEAGLLWLLMCRNRVTREEVIALFWPNPNTEPDCLYNSISVRLCYLRKKLAPVGFYISTSFNFGWRLETEKPRKLSTYDQYREAA